MHDRCTCTTLDLSLFPRILPPPPPVARINIISLTTIATVATLCFSKIDFSRRDKIEPYRIARIAILIIDIKHQRRSNKSIAVINTARSVVQARLFIQSQPLSPAPFSRLQQMRREKLRSRLVFSSKLKGWNGNDTVAFHPPSTWDGKVKINKYFILLKQPTITINLLKILKEINKGLGVTV